MRLHLKPRESRPGARLLYGHEMLGDMDPGSLEVDRPAGRPLSPSFFLTHGAGGDLNTPGLKGFSRALAGAGHLSVRANLPYRTAGRKAPPPAERSVPGFAALFDEARQQFGPKTKWVAGGRSYGGRVASMAAAEGLTAAGLIFFPYPLHRPGDPSRPRAEHWPAIAAPCLFIQGTKDPFCDMALLRKLLPGLGGKPTLIEVPGGEHSLRVRKSPGVEAKPEADVLIGLLPAILEWASGL